MGSKALKLTIGRRASPQDQVTSFSHLSLVYRALHGHQGKKNGLDLVSGLSRHQPPAGDVGKNNHDCRATSVQEGQRAGWLPHLPFTSPPAPREHPGMRGLMMFCPGRPPAGQTAEVQPQQPASPPLPHNGCFLGAHCELNFVLSGQMQNNTDSKPTSPGGLTVWGRRQT